jgi:hypothetical protein
MLMDSTIDHRKDENTVPKDDKYIVVNTFQEMEDGEQVPFGY